MPYQTYIKSLLHESLVKEYRKAERNDPPIDPALDPHRTGDGVFEAGSGVIVDQSQTEVEQLDALFRRDEISAGFRSRCAVPLLERPPERAAAARIGRPTSASRSRP